jgi:PAS domain S-box-containing protein
MLAKLGEKPRTLLEAGKELRKTREKINGFMAVRKEVFRAERDHSLFENMPDGFAYCRMLFQNNQPGDLLYLSVNRAFEKITGLSNVIGKKATEVIPHIREFNPELFEICGRVALTGRPARFEICLAEKKIWLYVTVYSTKKEYFVALFYDITDRKAAEEALKRANLELEMRVSEWTSELQAKTKKLDEVNTALKVLLNRREEERKELEETIANNIKSLVLPYTEKLKTTHLTDAQTTYLSILESNVREMTSSLAKRLCIQHISLTPTEMQVAMLVRDGRSTKEIAEILRISSKAVSFHRDNIRRKLGLKNKKANLGTYLASLP